jgi:opacity protein-like surface antigen
MVLNSSLNHSNKLELTMNKYLATFIAFASLICSSATCTANSRYVQIFGGPNWATLSDISQFNPTKLHCKPGYVVGASLGYNIWCAFRVEAEYSFRYNKITASITDKQREIPATLKGSGKLTTSAALANLLWDIPIGCIGFSPYIGGGVGYAWNAYRSSDRVHVDTGGTISCVHICKGSRNTNGFAWQLIGGVSIPLTLCIDLGLEYRYFKAAKHVRNQALVVSSKYLF